MNKCESVDLDEFIFLLLILGLTCFLTYSSPFFETIADSFPLSDPGVLSVRVLQKTDRSTAATEPSAQSNSSEGIYERS
jgi:hypothetical protein